MLFRSGYVGGAYVGYLGKTSQDPPAVPREAVEEYYHADLRPDSFFKSILPFFFNHL